MFNNCCWQFIKIKIIKIYLYTLYKFLSARCYSGLTYCLKTMQIVIIGLLWLHDIASVGEIAATERSLTVMRRFVDNNSLVATPAFMLNQRRIHHLFGFLLETYRRSIVILGGCHHDFCGVSEYGEVKGQIVVGRRTFM